LKIRQYRNRTFSEERAPSGTYDVNAAVDELFAIEGPHYL
jgi:hypothetical protein